MRQEMPFSTKAVTYIVTLLEFTHSSIFPKSQASNCRSYIFDYKSEEGGQKLSLRVTRQFSSVQKSFLFFPTCMCLITEQDGTKMTVKVKRNVGEG
jgi:hypothetical protein